MKQVVGLLVCSIMLAACSHHEIRELKNELSEAQTAVNLSAQNTKRLEETYSDMYFELNSLTVENFKTKVARGERFYAYIGRPSCSDCNAFEPMFKRYIARYRLHDKIYFVNVHKLHQDKTAWESFKRQYGLSGTPVLSAYGAGKQLNKLDWEDNGGQLSAQDLEKWLDLNHLR